MSGLIPQVEPLDPSTGNLTTRQGVDVAIEYTDFDVRDTTLVKWGIYSKMLAPVATDANPVQHTPVPSDHICNGYATAWFSIQDAIGNLSYSSAVNIVIALGANQGLDSASIAAVNSADPTAGMLVEVADDLQYDLILLPADVLVVMWKIYGADDSPAGQYSKTLTLPASIDGSFTTPALVPVPVHQQYMTVQYTLTRTQPAEVSPSGRSGPVSEQQFQSLTVKKFAQELWPDGSEELPAPIFTDAVDGVLYLDALQGDVQLAIPSTPYIMNSSVTFHGSGTDEHGQPVAAATWAPQPVVVATTPYDGTPVPRGLVHAVGNDGTFTASYSNGTYTSFGTSVIVKLKELDPPTGVAGVLWGWGDPESGTLG